MGSPSKEDLDWAAAGHTAFRTFEELVAAVRGPSGYGQVWIPTLRADIGGDEVVMLRDALADLGFEVSPPHERSRGLGLGIE